MLLFCYLCFCCCCCCAASAAVAASVVVMTAVVAGVRTPLSIVKAVASGMWFDCLSSSLPLVLYPSSTMVLPQLPLVLFAVLSQLAVCLLTRLVCIIGQSGGSCGGSKCSAFRSPPTDIILSVVGSSFSSSSAVVASISSLRIQQPLQCPLQKPFMLNPYSTLHSNTE